MGIVDISKLGMREVKREETVVVTDPKTQWKHQQRAMVPRMESQPILNEEEAALLWEADWQPTSKTMKKSGKFMCIVHGKRFFAEKKPAKPKEAKAAKDQ